MHMSHCARESAVRRWRHRLQCGGRVRLCGARWLQKSASPVRMRGVSVRNRKFQVNQVWAQRSRDLQNGKKNRFRFLILSQPPLGSQANSGDLPQVGAQLKVTKQALQTVNAPIFLVRE